jgi:ureidoacrylate peracid hydrolase
MDLQEKVSPDRTAVIVVDMQNDFCSREGAYKTVNPELDLEPIDEMVPRLSALLDDARRVGTTVIYVRAIYNTDDNRYLSPVWLEHAERRRHGLYTEVPLCKEGSWGAEIIPELQPHEGEMVITKHRYSAFIDTQLQAYLRNRSLDTIVVTGVGTNGCVESTARDGFMLDHYVVVPDDCVSTYWSNAHAASLETMGLLFGEVTTSRTIAEAWERSVSHI